MCMPEFISIAGGVLIVDPFMQCQQCTFSAYAVFSDKTDPTLPTSSIPDFEEDEYYLSDTEQE